VIYIDMRASITLIALPCWQFKLQSQPCR